MQARVDFIEQQDLTTPQSGQRRPYEREPRQRPHRLISEVERHLLSSGAVDEPQPTPRLCQASLVFSLLYDLHIIDAEVSKPEQRQG